MGFAAIADHRAEDLAAQREKNMQGISDRLDLLNDKMNDIAVTQGETQTQLNDLAKRVDGRPVAGV